LQLFLIVKNDGAEFYTVDPARFIEDGFSKCGRYFPPYRRSRFLDLVGEMIEIDKPGALPHEKASHRRFAGSDAACQAYVEHVPYLSQAFYAGNQKVAASHGFHVLTVAEKAIMYVAIHYGREPSVINVKKLKKRFGPITAVDGVSFSAAKGDVLGFIGPNGAGKTTTMRMIACLTRPDEGTAEINGFDIWNDSLNVRRSIGYLPENTPLYGEMTTLSFLRFIVDIRGIAGGDKERELERVIDICSLGEVVHQSIETLSKGYRKRVGLAQTLIGDPAVLILDEPTDGLDPNQKRDIRSLIVNMAQDKSIIVSTHILEEIEAICNRAIVINRGRIAADATPEEFRKQGGGRIDEFFETVTRGSE